MGSRSTEGVPAVVIMMAILAFISDLSNSITSATVPLLALNLGASLEFIGVMVALTYLMRLLLVQPVGVLCDRMDKRIFLVFGFIFFLINFLLLIFATNPLHILLGRVLQGIGGAMFYTSATSLILITAGESRGMAVGIYATLMGLGFSIGPILGGFVAEIFSYDTSYTLSALLALFSIAIILTAVKGTKQVSSRHSESIKTDEGSGYSALLKNKELLIACIGGFFMSEAIGADTSFFPVLGGSLSLSEGTIGTILGIRGLLSTIVRIPVGKAIEKIGSRRLMTMALFMAAIGLLLVPQFKIVWLFPLFLGLEGIGYGMFLTSANTYIGEVVNVSNRGAAVGLYNTFTGVGGAFNMTILGLIAGSIGIENTFRFTSILCFLGLSIITIISRRSVDHTPK